MCRSKDYGIIVIAWRHNKDRRECPTSVKVPIDSVSACFFKCLALSRQLYARPNPTGLSIFLSIATHVEFQIN